MLKSISDFIERHELQWCLYFILGAVTLVRVPEIITKDDIDSLRSTCGIFRHHVCITEGCFFEPAITSIGQPRAKLLGDETPTHVEILYKVSYFRSASRIIKTKASINCLQNYNHPTMSNIYVALIPAIMTAFFIIGLLIFLQPSSEVYYLVENKDEEEITAQFTIDDDSDEEICKSIAQSTESDDEVIYRTDPKKIVDIEEDPFMCDKSCSNECETNKTNINVKHENESMLKDNENVSIHDPLAEQQVNISSKDEKQNVKKTVTEDKILNNDVDEKESNKKEGGTETVEKNNDNEQTNNKINENEKNKHDDKELASNGSDINETNETKGAFTKKETRKNKRRSKSNQKTTIQNENSGDPETSNISQLETSV